MIRSWWPPQHTWDQCGYNVGYWTPQCEAWYQKRVRALHGGTAKLLSPAEWKSVLKFESNVVKQIVAGVNKCSVNFLNTHVDGVDW